MSDVDMDDKKPIVKEASVRISPSFVMMAVFRKIFNGLLALILILVLVYALVFVPTAARYLPTSQYGLILTKDPSIRNSFIPVGNIELVEMNSNKHWMDSMVGKMRAAFTYHRNVSKVRIAAVPGGRIRVNDKDEVFVNGKLMPDAKPPLNYKTVDDSRGWMSDQYFVQCISGACRAGEWYLIGSGDVIGELKTSEEAE